MEASRALSLTTLLVRDRDNQENATIQHLLWKLYHIDQGIATNTASIADLNEQLKKLRSDHSSFDEAQKLAKKEVAKAVKDAGKAEKQVKKAEKSLEDSVSSHC